MNLQELFKNDLEEQMPGMLQRLGTGFRAATGDPYAKGERQIVQITRDLANKIKRWAGTVGGLTVEHLMDYPPYKLDRTFQDMLAKLEIAYGIDGEIDPDQFDDELLNYVRQRARTAPTAKLPQATRGIDNRTASILTNLNDAQLQAWVKKARDQGIDDTNAVLVAAEAELARRGVGTNLPLNLGPGGGAQAVATPE